MSANEEWRPIADDQRYQVSTLGRVRGPSGKILVPRRHTNRYQRVSIGLGNDRYIHDLVLQTFIGPRPPGHEADHLDNDRANNRLTNLRWLALADNRARRILAIGERHPAARLQAHQVRIIKTEVAAQSDTAIARRYGVNRKTIADIRTGKTWSEIR